MILRKAGKVICSLQFDLIFFHSLSKKNPKELSNGPDSELHVTSPYNFN